MAMSKTYEINGGGELQAETPEELVAKMNASTFQQEETDQLYMEAVAGRLASIDFANAPRTSSATEFVEDLLKLGLLKVKP